MDNAPGFPLSHGNDRKGKGITGGKAQVGTILGFNIKITPEFLPRLLVFHLHLFLWGGDGTKILETYQAPAYLEKWSVSTYPSTQLNSIHSPCSKVVTTDSPGGASAKYKVNVPSTFTSGPSW